MKDLNYQIESAKTDSNYKAIQDRFSQEFITRFVHYSLGLNTECAEILDILKKHTIYNKPYLKHAILDEAGDCLWYLTQLLTLHGYSLEDAMEYNLKKLQTRYDGKFTEQKALEHKDENVDD